MEKILIYNSGGGLGDSIQLFPLLISLKNHYKKTKFFYLGAHSNHFNEKLKEYKYGFSTDIESIRAQISLGSLMNNNFALMYLGNLLLLLT